MTTDQRRPGVLAQSSSQGLPETIFAGLSFPSVPNSEIITVKQTLVSQAIEDDDEEESSQASKPLISNVETITNSSPKATSGGTGLTVNSYKVSFGNTNTTMDIKKHLSRLYSVPVRISS